MTPDRVVLGRLVRPHGLRGALILKSDAPVSDVLRPGLPVFVEPRDARGEALPHVVRRAAQHPAGALLELEGVDDRDVAGALAARDLTAARGALPPAPPGEYYECDLVGAAVECASGAVLGTLVEVLATGANDVWVVRTADGDELLVPAVAHAVLEVDAARRRIVVDAGSVTRASTSEQP